MPPGTIYVSLFLKMLDSSSKEMFWRCSSRRWKLSSLSAGNSVSLKGKTTFSRGRVELTFSNIVGSTTGLDGEEEGEDEEEEDEGEEVVEEVVLIMLDGVGRISLHRHTQHVKFKFAVLDKAITWDLLKPSHFE